jgi:hypothetical protein
MSANDRQVAGDHYRREIQHWDFVVACRMSYLGGQATKYVSRWRDKNGAVDLDKADHFLEKMQEVHGKTARACSLDEYLAAQMLDGLEAKIIHLIYLYETMDDPHFLDSARAVLGALRQGVDPAKPA